MCAAAVTYQEYPIRVIGQELAFVGPRPGKDESEQFENVLGVCGVLQLVVWFSQSIIRHGHRGRRVRGKAACESGVVLLIFA